VNKNRKAGLDLSSVNRGRLPRTTRLLLCSSLLISLCILFLVPYSWPDHKVGEPRLEELPVWDQCCREHDCIPQKVKIIGTEGNGKIPIEVEEYQALVKKGKFFPVPSSYTWVCYFDLNGQIIDRNIRCILYPQNSGTVNAPHGSIVSIVAQTGIEIPKAHRSN